MAFCKIKRKNEGFKSWGCPQLCTLSHTKCLIKFIHKYCFNDSITGSISRIQGLKMGCVYTRPKRVWGLFPPGTTFLVGSIDCIYLLEFTQVTFGTNRISGWNRVQQLLLLCDIPEMWTDGFRLTFLIQWVWELVGKNGGKWDSARESHISSQEGPVTWETTESNVEVNSSIS